MIEAMSEQTANNRTDAGIVTNDVTYNGAAMVVQPTAGLLALSDHDRADFLHRMTTNDINRLQSGQAAVTVLTSSTARIVQVFTVLCMPDLLWLLPSPGETSNLARHLQGQIFFMDKVKVENLSETYRRLRVVGKEAGAILATMGLAPETVAAEEWREVSFDGQALVLLNQQAYGVPGYELIIPATIEEPLQQALKAAGAVSLSEAAYQAVRIAAGRPAPGFELTGAYNPLEVGLGWTCAENKGCYTGQEIIARQITYDKITKTLVGLQSESILAVGQELTADGKAVGTVTSSADSKQGPIALAVVKRPHNEPGVTLDAAGTAVQVTELP